MSSWTIEPVVLERRQVVRVDGPRPGLDRLRLCARGRGELRGRHPSEPASRSACEQAQLEAEVDEPRAVEAAEARDEVVESFVEGHRRPIVACGNAAPGAGRVP